MSIRNPNFLSDLQQDLLGQNSDNCHKAIALLHQPEHTTDNIYFYRELIIISQLHPDENIKQQAAKAVVLQHGQDYFDNEAHVFEIFRSIHTLFPWESDKYYYTQISNYEAFAQAVVQYAPLICRFLLYRQQYLQLAQQLYLLFQLAIPAAEILTQITQYYPQDAEAYYALARIREQENQIMAAIALYEHCLQINPQHFYALTTFAPLIATQPDKSEYAIALFQRAIDIEPYSSELYADMAQVCYQNNQEARARQLIDIALSINSHQPSALNLLGKYYLEVEQNVQKALETYQMGLDHPLHGDNPLLLASMAKLCAQSLQEYDKAAMYYKKSLMANPIQPIVILEYVDLLIQFFHDYYTAIPTLQDYLKHRPDDEVIKQRLHQLFPNTIEDLQTDIVENQYSKNNDKEEDDDDDDDWEGGEAGSDE